MGVDIVHFHGTPIWGNSGEVLKHAVKDSGAFVSYARPDQIRKCLDWSKGTAIDNGAFSAWKRGLKLDWTEFYKWLVRYYYHEKMVFFIIPDEVEGSESENNKLIKSVPTMFKDKSVPVWHLHESLDKLDWLCNEFDRVAFGSSAEYASVRSAPWRVRMYAAFDLMYGRNHKTKIHGLRMLDGRVLGNYPLSSADSTSLATNIPKYKVKFPDMGKHIINRKPFDKSELLLYRCATLKNAIESVYPPTLNDFFHIDYNLK